MTLAERLAVRMRVSDFIKMAFFNIFEAWACTDPILLFYWYVILNLVMYSYVE